MSQLIEHTGIVRHIEGNSIQVLIVQQSACSGCHTKGVCTVADHAEKLIDIETTDTSFQVGEKVLLVGQQSMGLLAVMWAFVIPFVLILVTLFILGFYVANEALSGVIALSVLIPYYVALSFFNQKLKAKFKFSIRKDVAD